MKEKQYLNTQVEFWKALLEGKIIKTIDYPIYYKVENNLLFRKCEETTWKEENSAPFAPLEHNQYYIYEQPEWYENIPEQGVLCWVWDNSATKKTKFTSIISRKEDDRFISIYGNSWINATPMTKEEALSLIYEEKEI